MKKKVYKRKKETQIFCDFCGSEAVPFSNRVQPCPICKRDTCHTCAIVTDHWYLEAGSFMSDYPDQYCKECWDKGKEIRANILKCREDENKLWEEWRKLGQ